MSRGSPLVSNPRGMDDDRQRWEERYRAKTTGPVGPPSSFLVQHAGQLPRGRALDIACGDGRHAIWLSRRGFRVDAIDIAMAGLRRAQVVLRRERLAINLIQADMERFPLPHDRYHLILNIRYLQRDLFPVLKHALRDDGVIVLETFLVDQATICRPTNPAFLLERGELQRAFDDFDLLVSDEGRFETETGPGYLARLIARRPPSWAMAFA